MSSQHGVASAGQARAAGVTRRVEQRLIRDGSLEVVHPKVFRLAGSPVTFETEAMAASLAPGISGVSHGAAARLHGLDGFDRHRGVDVIAPRPMNLTDLTVRIHWTRGPLAAHIVRVGPIPTMCIASTLALLAPAAGIGRTARALDSALRLGISSEHLRQVAHDWRKPGRSGPAALLMLLGERVDQRLPRSWFQRLAKRLLAADGIRLVDEYPVHDAHGRLLAQLDLADPGTRVGVECQSWEWHATPAAQHRDARRRGMLRQLGWEIVDVWWSDLRHPDRVLAELRYLLRQRRA